MLTGSCLCGGVAYEVDAAVGPHRALPLCHLQKSPWLCLFLGLIRPEG